MTKDNVSEAIAIRLGFGIEEILEQRDKIARVLAEFYRAPLSMSSVQPILDLAVELNPEFQRSLPGMAFQNKSSIIKEKK